MRSTLLRILAAVLAVVSVAGPVHAELGSDHTSADHADGSWVVELAPGVRPSESAEIADDHGGYTRMIWSNALRGFNFRGSTQDAERLASDARVRTVEPDIVFRVAEHAGKEWGGEQRRLAVPSAVHDNHVGQGTRVAVLDTGVGDHPFFENRLDRRRGAVCAGGGGGTHDANGHGTRTASNVLRVARQATIVPVRVFPSGSLTTALSNVLCGVDHVTSLNTNGRRWDDIDVANASLAAPGSCSNARAFCRAITRSVDSGSVYTVAAGNNSSNAGGFLPGAHGGVINVSALSGDNSTTLAGFSNKGPAVDMTAPGVNIRSAVPGGGWTLATGTSRSAPLVGGVAAIVKSLHPEWSADKVRRIMSRAGQCPNGEISHRIKSCAPGKGTWGNDTDGVTESVPHARLAGRLAGSLPYIDVRRPRDQQVLSDGHRIRVQAHDESRWAVNRTPDLDVLWKVKGNCGNSTWTALDHKGDGKFALWWDTNIVGNGSCVLKVVARDVDGNSTRSWVPIEIAN